VGSRQEKEEEVTLEDRSHSKDCNSGFGATIQAESPREILTSFRREEINQYREFHIVIKVNFGRRNFSTRSKDYQEDKGIPLEAAEKQIY